MVRMPEWYRNAKGAGGVPESDGWVEELLLEWNRKAMAGVPGRLAVLEGYRKASLGVKDG